MACPGDVVWVSRRLKGCGLSVHSRLNIENLVWMCVEVQCNVDMLCQPAQPQVSQMSQATLKLMFRSFFIAIPTGGLVGSLPRKPSFDKKNRPKTWVRNHKLPDGVKPNEGLVGQTFFLWTIRPVAPSHSSSMTPKKDLKTAFCVTWLKWSHIKLCSYLDELLVHSPDCNACVLNVERPCDLAWYKYYHTVMEK